MIKLTNEDLLSVEHNLTDEDQMNDLCEMIGCEYGSGFVVGRTRVIYEEEWGDGFAKDVAKWSEEILNS